MILFQKDWMQYGRAKIHTTTKNTSFLRLADVYRKMGVKNNSFHLALLNPELEHVDPHSLDLTPQQMAAVAIECKLNPWYFFREVVRIPVKGSTEAVPLQANRGNIAAYWLFFNHITFFLIQIRQTGKSVSIDALMVLLLNVLCQNTLINLLTKDDKLRSENIKRIKDIDMELPFYLRQRTKNDLNNTEQLSVKALSNNYIGHVPQKSPKDALNQGRGFTSPIFHIDEAPFQSNIAIAMPAALAAGTAARDSARQNNTPYGTIITTTAGKKDDKDGKYAYNLVSNSTEWTEALLDCIDPEALEKAIRSSNPHRELRVNCTFNHKQLGKTDEWLKRAVEEAMVTGEDADRDFGNVWTSGTQASPLPVHLIEKIRASQKDPLHVEISKIEGYVTRWYIPQEEINLQLAKSFFVMSMDTSDASGGDDISMLLTDIRTGKVVAAGSYNETNIITFAQWLASWFTRFENFVCIIERRSTGSAIIDYLLYILPSLGIDPFKRLFNRCVNDLQDYPERWREINAGVNRKRSDVINAHKKTFGFATSGSGITSRTDLYSTTLQNAAKKIGDKIYDKKTIDQIAGLTIVNGRVDHQPGEHDDMVISLLLMFWLLTQGKNLSHYGIDSRTIFMESKVEDTVDRNTMMQRREQLAIRAQIDEIVQKMEVEKDTYIQMRLEHQLRVLNRSLVLEEGEVFSVDDLINEMKNNKYTKAKQDNPVDYSRPIYNSNGYYSGGIFG